ncbi:MAG TPA: CARDB domain-containing protein [Roseiflexaceae bacterium]|nr:CARDB domain-containing protein [Roseiflexaceae bacterium]
MSGPQRWANRAGPRLSLIAAILLALCAGLLTRPAPVKAAAFTAGNLVVVRVGDGSATLTNASTAVFLDEFSPSGTPVQSIGLPTSTSGGNAALTMSGSATSEGTLARSPNGAYLTLAGYDAAPGTAGIGATASATTNRIIGRIDSSGAINTTTRISDGYNTDNIRAAVTDDGTGFWASGNGATNTGGVRYVAFGSSGASTQLSTSVTNTRVPGIFGGQLYVSASSGTFRGVSTVGSGLPTTGGQTIAGLPGFPTASGPSSYSFVLFDLSAAVAGLDTAYVADDRSIASGGGLQKWTFNGSTWTLAYTLSSGLAGGLRGLTGISGANPVLYATTADASANKLVTITDTGAGAAFTTLATAPTNTIFRGVALAPVAPQPDLAVAVSGPATATAGVSYSYTVTVSNVGGADASGVEARFTLPAGLTYNSVSGTDGFGCAESGGTVTCTGATIGAGTGATITVSVTSGAAGRVTAPVGAAVADPSNTVAETNEGNNSSTSAVVTTVDAAPNTPPTIGVTSNEPRLPSPVFSGVIGDPTDPGAQLGLTVTVGDAETPAADLVLTASSSNTAVVPNNPANLAITSTGATRTLRVVPAGVGYATITLTVTDAGNQTATATLTYAASAATLTPTTSRFHTGAADISTAVAVDANVMFVANDEDQVLRLYDRTNSGAPLASFDVTASLNLTDMGGSGPREVDIEASARSGSRIYWVASHSNASGGNQRPNRSRLFATDITGTGATSTLSFVGYYGGLKSDLVAWDQSNGHGKGANHYGFAASTATGVIPEDPGGAGFNIEAAEFAPDGSTLYLGFRAPIVPATSRTKALIVPVTNPAALVGASPATGPATFGAPIEFDLGGRGIRELRKNSANEYLLLAGPPDTATSTAPKDFRLYSWTGNPGDAPLLRVANLTALNTGGSFESIVEVPSPLGSTSQIQLLSDNGDTVWYGDGVIAKELPNNPHKKFRSDRVVIDTTLPDTTAPETTITLNPTSRVSSTSATFVFTGTDDVTAQQGLVFECSLDGAAFAACVNPQNYANLAQGSHTFLVRARDADGNLDPSPASFTWIVDTIAPETLLTGQPPLVTNILTATFVFTGTDSGTGLAAFECSLDSGPWTDCESPQVYGGLAFGSHTFLVRAKDHTGNVDLSPATHTWVVARPIFLPIVKR